MSFMMNFRLFTHFPLLKWLTSKIYYKYTCTCMIAYKQQQVSINNTAILSLNLAKKTNLLLLINLYEHIQQGSRRVPVWGQSSHFKFIKFVILTSCITRVHEDPVCSQSSYFQSIKVVVNTTMLYHKAS